MRGGDPLNGLVLLTCAAAKGWEEGGGGHPAAHVKSTRPFRGSPSLIVPSLHALR